MTLYARSNWARLQIDNHTDPEILNNFKTFDNWFRVSALAARINLWDPATEFTFGINPLDQARIDTQEEYGLNEEDLFYALVDKDDNTGKVTVDNVEYDFSPYYGTNMMLSEDTAGFWFVRRKRIDNEDQDSQREDLAAKMYKKPFRLLDSEDKNEIRELMNSDVVATRKQYAVLIDFSTGVIFTDMTDDKTLVEFYIFMKDIFKVKVSATTLFFGPNERPWQYDFFKKILDNNIIDNEMNDLVNVYLDDEKLSELRTEYPIIDSLYRKKKTFCQYSDEKYLVGLQVPATISDSKLKANVGASDNISCWEILSEIEEWDLLEAYVVAGSEQQPMRWKLQTCMQGGITNVYKGLEFSKSYIDDHCEEVGTYLGHCDEYLKCLQVFEGLYLALIKRILDIEEDDTSTGIKYVAIEMNGNEE